MNVQATDPKTDLTLSAAGEIEPAYAGALTAEPGYPRVIADPRCPDCVARRPHVEHKRYSRPQFTRDVPIRSERDRLTPALEAEALPPRVFTPDWGEEIPETEQRALWGDR